MLNTVYPVVHNVYWRGQIVGVLLETFKFKQANASGVYTKTSPLAWLAAQPTELTC